MRRLTLRLRLFLSYALVAVVGAAVMAAVIEIVGRQLFDHHMTGMGFEMGGHAGAGMADLQATFGWALTRALLVALAVSLVAAVAAAVLVAGRLLRPIDAIRDATHRLAAGHYEQIVPEPHEPELAALVRDVNSLGRALDATERRRAALIGDVAHEMRTPLTAVRGYTDGLADGIFPAEEVLPKIGVELQRLERLAADLASVSRSEEGALHLHLADDDLGDIVGAATERLRAQYRDRNVQLIVDAGRVAPVRADRDRLIQALTNVIGNALSYTPAGGTVRVSLEPGQNASAAVTVTDTGIGLAPGDEDRVFERFFRVDSRRHAGGSGVGLTIARSIARAHGGDLTAASSGLGKGSTFRLVLPARHRVSGGSAPSPPTG